MFELKSKLLTRLLIYICQKAKMKADFRAALSLFHMERLGRVFGTPAYPAGPWF